MVASSPGVSAQRHFAALHARLWLGRSVMPLSRGAAALPRSDALSVAPALPSPGDQRKGPCAHARSHPSLFAARVVASHRGAWHGCRLHRLQRRRRAPPRCVRLLDIAARLRLLTALSNLQSPVTQPPHPKFLLLPKRWWSIRTHLVTGVIEITASVAGLVASAVFGASVAPYIRFAAPAGIIHALTALYQTELVFGAKIIMRPAYYCVGYMHLLAAVASACAPERESRLLTQYMVLCIFTWCRVYMTLFRAINIAMPVVYSLSITLAGFTTGTVVLGPLGSARPSCGAPGTCAAGWWATACPSWRRQLPKPDAPCAPQSSSSSPFSASPPCCGAGRPTSTCTARSGRS